MYIFCPPGDLNTPPLSLDADGLDFIAAHSGVHELTGTAEFLAAEIADQLLTRINDQYPVTQGYHPLHIALMTPGTLGKD